MFFFKKFLVCFSVFFLLTTNSFSLTDNEKVTRAFNYLTSWLIKYKDKSRDADLIFPKNLSFDECYEMQTELLSLNSVNQNNLTKDSYDTLMYLADGSGENPINFHLIASVFNDLCADFFGKTKDG